MIATNEQWREFKRLNENFSEKFGDIIPLLQMPETVTFEEICGAVNKCFSEGRNMLAEIFGWEDDNPNILY